MLQGIVILPTSGSKDTGFCPKKNGDVLILPGDGNFGAVPKAGVKSRGDIVSSDCSGFTY